MKELWTEIRVVVQAPLIIKKMTFASGCKDFTLVHSYSTSQAYIASCMTGEPMLLHSVHTVVLVS